MAQEESTLETFWRSIIMLGTLVVGGMAFYLYGPPPEKAAAMLDHVASRVGELLEDRSPTAQPVTTSSTASSTSLASTAGPSRPANAGNLAPPTLATRSLTTAASLGAAPQFASSAPQSPLTDPSLAPLAAELAQLGATDLDLQPWGETGVLHRFCCTAPMNGAMAADSGVRRHFNAIESSATAAVTAVLAELREWRTAANTPIYR